MLKSKRWLAAKAIALLCICALLFSGCTTAAAKKAEPELMQDAYMGDSVEVYKTVTLETGDYVKQITKDGYPYYPQQTIVELEADNVLFDSYAVRLGDHVEEGALLATFKPKGENVRADQLRVSIAALQKELDEGVLDRTNELIEFEEDNKKIPRDTEEKRRTYKLQQEKMSLGIESFRLEHEYKINTMRSELNRLQTANNGMQVYAPHAGTVDYIGFIKEGETCSYGTVLVVLSSMDKFGLYIENPDQNIRLGQAVNVTYGKKTDRQSAPAHVAASSNCLPSELKSDFGYVTFDDPSSINYEDLYNVTVEVNVVEVYDVPLLPKEAVTSENGTNYVSIVDGKVLKKRYVQTGFISQDSAWILQGVTPEDQVALQ